MATLEMVQLRSAMPPMGLVTLRHEIPPFKQLRLTDATPQVLSLSELDDDESVETGQETAARKGGEAR
jgi:hypothetical protein